MKAPSSSVTLVTVDSLMENESPMEGALLRSLHDDLEPAQRGRCGLTRGARHHHDEQRLELHHLGGRDSSKQSIRVHWPPSLPQATSVSQLLSLKSTLPMNTALSSDRSPLA